MAEKTYVVAVAHENMTVGQTVIAEPTSRMEALLGAGYYYVKNVAYPVVEVRVASLEQAQDWVDDASDTELLERFEELDMVEVITKKPKRTASPKRTKVE